MKLRFSILTNLILSIFIFISYQAFAQTDSLQGIFSGQISWMKITGKKFHLDNKKKIGFYSVDVKVTTESMTMTCERLDVYYIYIEGTKGNENPDPIIDRIIATEDVRIDLPGDESIPAISATADKVEYSNTNEMMVMTGNPVFKYGDDFMEGSKITIDIRNEEIDIDDPEGDIVFAPSAKR